MARRSDGKPPESGEIKLTRKRTRADDSDGLGLKINLQECYEQFAERAKVLPFVRPEKRG